MENNETVWHGAEDLKEKVEVSAQRNSGRSHLPIRWVLVLGLGIMGRKLCGR